MHGRNEWKICFSHLHQNLNARNFFFNLNKKRLKSALSDRVPLVRPVYVCADHTWNSIPNTISKLQSLTSFTKHLKAWLLKEQHHDYNRALTFVSVCKCTVQSSNPQYNNAPNSLALCALISPFISIFSTNSQISVVPLACEFYDPLHFLSLLLVLYFLSHWVLKDMFLSSFIVVDNNLLKG